MPDEAQLALDQAPKVIDLARERAFTLGVAEVRPSTREIVAGDQRQVVEPRVMQVLAALARHRGEVVSRDELIALCWGGRVVGEDAIDRCIGAIRKLAEAHGGFSVTTIARVGYRLDEAAGRAAEGRRPRAGRWALALAAAVVLALGLGLGVWFLRDRLRGLESQGPLQVAVLPFDASGQGPAAGAFADAVASQISDELASLHVEMLPRSESIGIHGAQASAQLARRGIGLVVDGEIRSDGKTIAVHVRLSAPREHATLWSKTLESGVQDAEDLRMQVAARVASTTFMITDPAVAKFRDKPDIVATYVDCVDELEERGIGRSLSLARELVARAPNFSMGHAWLANLLVIDAVGRTPDAQDRALAEAKREAKRALELDPKNGHAYGVMAYMTPFTHWRERDQLLLKSAEVQPNNLTLHIFSTWSLRNAGRTSEALAQAKLAVDTSPWDAASRWNLALALLQDGRAQDAANVVAEARRLHPRNVWLAFGDLFVAELSAPPSPRMFAIMDDPVWNGVPEAGIFPLLRGGYTTARSGDAATKRATADIVRDVGLRHPVAPSDVIGLLSALGDIDGAFLVADRFAAPANVEKPMAFQPFDTDSLFAPSGAALRRDPRFMRLAARLGLVDYWRSTGHWPDFCNNDQLPYDCQVEAARLARR